MKNGKTFLKDLLACAVILGATYIIDSTLNKVEEESKEDELQSIISKIEEENKRYDEVQVETNRRIACIVLPVINY